MHGIAELSAVYGCSMGGSIALLTALENKVSVKHCIMDGGITPYQLPWIITRFIALKDYILMMIGRAGGVRLLQKVFAADDSYSESDLQYVADVLKHCSRKTLWRTFDSCNNYKMPNPLPDLDTKIHYWFSEGEENERKQDIAYMREYFPGTIFTKIPQLGHGGLVLLKPEEFSDMIHSL